MYSDALVIFIIIIVARGNVLKFKKEKQKIGLNRILLETLKKRVN